MLKNVYLARVYYHNKKLFYIIIAFTGLTILCNLSGDEITPFFVWGMYSEKIITTDKYEFFRTTVNDTAILNTYSGYSDNKRFYLNSPLTYYKAMLDNKSIDPTVSMLKKKLKNHYKFIQPWESKLFNNDGVDFMGWYKRYLEQITSQTIYSVNIEVIRVYYNERQGIVTDSIYTFQKWKQP